MLWFVILTELLRGLKGHQFSHNCPQTKSYAYGCVMVCSLGLLSLGSHVCPVSGRTTGMFSRAEIWCWVRACNRKWSHVSLVPASRWTWQESSIHCVHYIRWFQNYPMFRDILRSNSYRLWTLWLLWLYILHSWPTCLWWLSVIAIPNQFETWESLWLTNLVSTW